MQTETPSTTLVNPTTLAPDWDNLPGEIVAEEYPFWIGVTADCPRGQIDVAGLHFPKVEEEITTNHTGQQVRVPKVGTVNKTVTKRHFLALVKVLPRLVIRQSHAVEEPTDGSGKNIGDPAERAKGRLIKIPTEDQILGIDGQRKLAPYVKQPGDRPASEFMFFTYAPDGLHGSQIRTIAEAGLEWPEEIEELEALNDILT